MNPFNAFLLFCRILGLTALYWYTITVLLVCVIICMNRDHPAVIKRRFTSVLIVSALSPVFVWAWKDFTGIQVILYFITCVVHGIFFQTIWSFLSLLGTFTCRNQCVFLHIENMMRLWGVLIQWRLVDTHLLNTVINRASFLYRASSTVIKSGESDLYSTNLYAP